MRVADYIAEFLRENRVRTVFMLSGTGSIYLDDALSNCRGLRFVCARHEAAAVVMAKAEAQLTGGIGAATVTTGPGGINGIAGVAEAWADSVPVIVLSGQVERKQYLATTRTFGVQGFNIVDLARTVTKYAAYVDDPEAIRFHLEKALYLARQGRPGPVWLDIPLDVQAAPIDPARLSGFVPARAHSPSGASLDADMETMVAAFQHARRPLLILGQGVRSAGAVDAFVRMADYLNVPVQLTRLALDILPYSTDYNMGLGGIRGRPNAAAVARQADLVLSLGASLSHSYVGEQCNAFHPDANVFAVEIDSNEIAKSGVKKTPFQHDARDFIHAFLNQMHRIEPHRYADWLASCKQSKQDWPIVRDCDRQNPINSYHLAERIGFHSGPGDVIVNDAGSAYYIAGQALTFEHGQREITSSAFATMGMALPLAIGAAATSPEVRVIAITGDGSIETNIQELRTISENGFQVKVFVINNGGYASIRDSQDASCGGRYTDTQNVLDFSKVAAAFELPYLLIDDVRLLDDQLRAVLARPGPLLIEVVCDCAQKMMRPLV